MPKGALLHAHLDATVNAEFLWDLALKQPGIHVRVAQPLSAANLATNLPEFRILPSSLHTDVPSLSDASYIPGEWVPLHNARNSFATELGGSEGFDKYVISSMTINPAEAYGTHNTVEKVGFNLVFSRSLLNSVSLCRSGRNSSARLLLPR